ncbi:translation elongation factor Ts [Sharpea azabuensis]|uniref:Elongation factor Ts n=1 Tax=Sharpea azabuensis TaxID=322505 RepID=A0A1H6PZY8_9FIRM|nr:translation elongation factor Ts [Sharpea azabuensis]HAV17804.1 elongation factor Ts [Erysipelotrichaceae bacterium]MDD6512409.1 translation elongation factor Ts [Sharpea azabuensis]MEE3308158.1 translation elongation factor Ts [Sharpea azabuensis]SEI37168.1 elongation factor Ts [Sharpea azabuensis]SFD42659.1 elongation factor Ts [Sharpea azabuensis]
MAISAKLVKELREKTGAGMMDCKKALDATNGDLEAAFDWLREKGIAKAAKKADRIAAEGLAAFAIDGDKAALVEVNSETDFVAKNEEFKELVNMIAKAVAEAQVNTVEETLKLVVDGQDLDTIIKEKTGKIGEKLSLRRVVAMSKSEGETFGAYSHMGGTVAALVKVANADDEKARDVAMHVAASAPQYISEDEIPEDVRERELNVLKTQALEENAKAAKPKPENILHKIVEGRLKKNFKEVCLNDQAFIKNPDQTVAQYLGNGKVEMMARFKVGEGIEKKEENFAAEVAAQMKA